MVKYMEMGDGLGICHGAIFSYCVHPVLRDMEKLMFEVLCGISALAGGLLTLIVVLGPILPDWMRM